MKRKQIVDLIIAIVLIMIGCIVLIFPLLKIIDIKFIFIGVLTLYGVMNLIQFLLTNKEKDYEGLFTMLASIITLLAIALMDPDLSPMNLALTLFIWIGLMSLIKLKKCDYYHDRHKKIWILKIITLILFILSGLLTVINLYYQEEVQILVLGFFYFNHGILELVDPITNYLIDKKK